MARLDMQTMKDVLVKKIDISEIKTVYDIGCLNGADSFLLSELFILRYLVWLSRTFSAKQYL